MTRAEVEALAAEMAEEGTTTATDEGDGSAWDSGFYTGRAEGFRASACMLLEALAKSEAPCDALCPRRGIAGGQRCTVLGPHVMHEVKGSTSWPDYLTEERALKVSP